MLESVAGYAEWNCLSGKLCCAIICGLVKALAPGCCTGRLPAPLLGGQLW